MMTSVSSLWWRNSTGGLSFPSSTTQELQQGGLGVGGRMSEHERVGTVLGWYWNNYYYHHCRGGEYKKNWRRKKDNKTMRSRLLLSLARMLVHSPRCRMVQCPEQAAASSSWSWTRILLMPICLVCTAMEEGRVRKAHFYLFLVNMFILLNKSFVRVNALVFRPYFNLGLFTQKW